MLVLTSQPLAITPGPTWNSIFGQYDETNKDAVKLAK